PRGERRRTLPPHGLEPNKVPGEYRTTVLEIEAVPAEAAALSHQHALGPALRDFEVRGDRVRPLEQARRRSPWNVGELGRKGEYVPAGGIARPRGDETRRRGVVQGEDVVLDGLAREEVLQVTESAWFLLREVVALRGVVLEVVELPGIRLGRRIRLTQQPG